MPTAIAILAKAPIEGFAKTRLIPRLGAAGAARLQRRLIERSIQTAIAAALGPVSLWCTPSTEHDAFACLAARYELRLFRQADGDLGARMLHAFETLTVKGPTLLMGTDCAVITSTHLQRCAVLLSGADATAVPVEDGGYILLGLHRPVQALFTGVDWGTPDVMNQTRSKAETAGLDLVELEPLWDIDRPEDYNRAIAQGAL